MKEVIVGIVVFVAIWSWMVVGWIVLPAKMMWGFRAGGAMLIGAMAGITITPALRDPATVLLGLGMTGSSLIAALVSIRWYGATHQNHQAQPIPPNALSVSRGVSPTVFRTKPSGALNQRLARRNG